MLKETRRPAGRESNAAESGPGARVGSKPKTHASTDRPQPDTFDRWPPPGAVDHSNPVA